MLEASILLVAAVGAAGFLFTDKCIIWRYSLSRDDGQRFYLRSLAFGVPFFAICFLAFDIPIILTEKLNLPTIWLVSPQNKAIFISIFTPVISYISARLINCFLSEDTKVQLFEKAMLSNDFDAILWESMSTYEPIAISLDNRKVYVGLVADGLEPNFESNGNSYLTIIPLLSGYRDRESMKFQISAVYEPVIEALSELGSEKKANSKGKSNKEVLRSYFMAFPREKIVSLHLFNDHLYQTVSGQYESKQSN